jgi:hypothetical protein
MGLQVGCSRAHLRRTITHTSSPSRPSSPFVYGVGFRITSHRAAGNLFAGLFYPLLFKNSSSCRKTFINKSPAVNIIRLANEIKLNDFQAILGAGISGIDAHSCSPDRTIPWAVHHADITQRPERRHSLLATSGCRCSPGCSNAWRKQNIPIAVRSLPHQSPDAELMRPYHRATFVPG